jgi:2-oxoglutarate ferredoxin oxidoreductase subunit delta
MRTFAENLNPMRQRFFRMEHTKTSFIALDTKKCEACWNCISACTNDVIGKIDLPWHKHIRFTNSSACTGCLKCVKACKSGAISKIINQ